jgi:SEC-C motif-containing protein
MNCPCGNSKSYAACCQLAHQSHKAAKTAAQLMRSRYSAFVLADGNYLMTSHHPQTRPLKEKERIVAWAKSVEWIALTITSKTKGLEKDTEGTVTFTASFKEKGQLSSIDEHSKFVKENGCWYYVGFAST